MSITHAIVSIAMNYSTTLTQKGQVTIPIDIRRSMGLIAGQKVSFVTKGDDVIIKPAKKFISLRGSVTRFEDRKYSDEVADKSVLKLIKKTYE